MASNAAPDRNVLLPVGVSALVHLAVVWGWPGAVETPPVESQTAPSLVWLSSDFAVPEGEGVLHSPSGGSETGEPAPAERPAMRTPHRPMRAARVAASSVPAAREPVASSAEAVSPSLAHSPGGSPDAHTDLSTPSAANAALAAAAGEGTSVLGAGPGGTAGHGAGNDTGALGDASASGGHGPTLMAFRNPCAGFFPTGAHTAHGSVQVEVEVEPDGRPAAARVVAELPRGEGFAGAARACAARLRFTPATTQAGTPVAGRARLLLRFDRT